MLPIVIHLIIMKLRIQKISDEGSHVPFVARIWMGLCNLRDDFLQSANIALDSGRKIFDDGYKPVLDSLVAIRSATHTINKLVFDHRRKAEAGELVSLQHNAIEIKESIDLPLMQNLSIFINSGARALKSMQPLLTNYGIDIGFLFQKEAKYQQGLCDLQVKDAVLFEYISSVRSSWSEKFMERRNLLEHHGWCLSRVNYRISPDNIVIFEPDIDGLLVTQYADKMSNRINAFVEELIAYAFSKLLLASFVLTEIPDNKRHPSNPTRFEITLAGTGKVPWGLKYDDTGFH